MRMCRVTVMATTACLVATAAAAQEPAPPVTLAAYYRCDYVRQTRADTLYRQVYAPALDRQIKAGRLSAYGFSSHRMGGAWRRLESWTAPTLGQLIAAQDAVQEEVTRTNPKGAAEFGAICGSHDDYIWQRVLGSPVPAAAPAFSYSRYLVCDFAREGEADMIMTTAFAAIMNKHLAAGHIASWGWLTHNMGGPVRRVLNWGGPDVMAVLNAEEMIATDMANHPMDGAFNAVCNSHSDYLWHSEVSGR